MRVVKKNSPKEGDTRSVSKFLWFPLTIEAETRWLEMATYTEVYGRAYSYDGLYDLEWAPSYWGTPQCPHGYEDWDECHDCCH